MIETLTPYHNVTVFFGHIHQELVHMTGHIAHHAARSTMFVLPSPDTPGQRTPLPWDPSRPNAGLGYRSIDAAMQSGQYALSEIAMPEVADQ